MARITHIALKVEDLERSTKFYEDVFGFRQTGTGYARGHVSRHMTDGDFDLALMVYDNEEVHEAQLSGPGPCIHHWGIEVEDRPATIKLIEENGGEIISKPGEGALKFRAPNGTVAEIVGRGRYKKSAAAGPARVVRLAIKVADLEPAARFYKNVFGFEDVRSERGLQHATRHLSDGSFDLVLIAYDSEEAKGARLAGAGPRIHHWGIEVADKDACADAIARNGGELLSPPTDVSITFRAPDGTLVEIAPPGK